jgi:hypothetical protein
VIRTRNLPDVDRLSILAAAILLAYALARYVQFPATVLDFTFFGIYLPIAINVNTIVSFFAAGLMASGTDWLLRDHPQLVNHNTIDHWLLPALTAWVIGFPLYQLPIGPLWWAGFVLGGVLLVLVIIAEYIVISPDDIRQPVAAAGLTALSFSLYLMLAVAMRFAGIRLIQTLPALTLAAGLVSLRTLHLRLRGKWAFLHAGIICLICAQVAAAFHYLPLSPVSYGLLLLGPLYALTSLIGNLAEGEPVRQAIVEPAFILLFLVVIAVWLGQ